jgi:hypothetical protein
VLRRPRHTSTVEQPAAPLRTGGPDKPAYVRHPLPHHRPQYIEKATLKRGRQGWYLVYNFPVAFNMFEMGIVIPIPSQLAGHDPSLDHLDGLKVSCYVRQYVNAALSGPGREDSLVSSQEDSEEHHHAAGSEDRRSEE